MTSYQPGFTFYDSVDERQVDDIGNRWRAEDGPRSIQENPIHGTANSRELAVLLQRIYVIDDEQYCYGYALGQSDIAKGDSGLEKPGRRELIAPTIKPLEFTRYRGGDERVYGEPSLVGKVGGGPEHIYVFRAEGADPESHDPSDYMCLFADTAKGQVSEPIIKEVTDESIELLCPVFRDGDKEEAYLARVLRWDQQTGMYKLESSVDSGWRKNVLNVNPVSDAVENYNRRVDDAAALEATLDSVTSPGAVKTRAMLDKFMLEAVGHRDPSVRRKDGLPGNDFRYPVAMGFTAGENAMTIAVRARANYVSANREDYQVTIGNLATGESEVGRIVKVERNANGWCYLDAYVSGRKVNVKYHIGETGAAYDVHCSIEHTSTANDNVRPMAELMDGVEQRLGSGLGGVVELETARERFATLVTSNSNAARVLSGFGDNYSGRLAHDGLSYDNEEPPAIERNGREYKTPIGTVFIGYAGDYGDRICHIRCVSEDGGVGRPDDIVVDVVNLYSEHDWKNDADVKVNWVTTEEDSEGRRILRIGFGLSDLGDVQISCVLDEHGKGSEFSLHKLYKRMGPLPTLDDVLDRVQDIEQERRAQNTNYVGERAVDSAMAAA